MAHNADNGLIISSSNFMFDLEMSLACGILFSTAICLLLSPPCSRREWIAAILSSVAFGVGGGSAVILHFQLQDWAGSVFGLFAIAGIVFGCGLPAWAVVHWIFNFINIRRDQGIDEVIKDIHQKVERQ